LKRYRYTGKERDGETGLYYHGARYYAAWLGRWVSCDPIGIAGGINVFVYTSNSPINRIDPNGMEDCTASSFVCDPAKYKPSSSSSKAAAFGSKEWEAKERLKMETELSRYGQGSINNESLSHLQDRLFQARAKNDVMASEDQTVYLQSSGRQATDAQERETVRSEKLANFNPGTPLGGVASVLARVVSAIVGASPENTEKAAGVAGAIGDVANSGLAVRGAATRGIGVGAPDARPKQWGAPVDNTPVVAPAPAATPAAPAPAPAPQIGAYRNVGGHHVHQSASFTTSGSSAKNNPNHNAAIAIQQGVPGFTEPQHDLASAAQRNINRGMRGDTVNQPNVGTLHIGITGNGTSVATPSIGFEDVKAFYALRAGGLTPDQALRLVQISRAQIDSVGAAPVRVPTR